jgi:hypothetical protein
MTLVSCWVLDLPSLFSTPTLSSLDPDGRHTVRPIVGLLSKHYDTVYCCSLSGAGGRGCHHHRWLWPVVASPVGEWVQGSLLALGCEWHSRCASHSHGVTRWLVHSNVFSQPHVLVVLWAQVPMGNANSCGSMLSGSVRSLRLSALSCSAGWGKLCFSSGTCGWLTHLLLSVRYSGRL